MKKNLFTSILLVAYGLFNFGFTQQNVILDIDGRKYTLPDVCYSCQDSYDSDDHFEYIKFAFPEAVYGENQADTKQKAKEKILSQVYPDFREHNAGITQVLLNHAEQFVKIRFDDYIVPTNNREKRQGLGNFKFFIEEAKVNKNLIICYAKGIDAYMSDNVVVIYQPIAAAENIELYEEVRRRIQAEYVSQQYKRTSVQNIEVMPVCEIQETDTSKINYYHELIQCINRQPGINAGTAIVVRDVRVSASETKAGGLIATPVEIHLEAFNTNTNSFVMNEFIKTTGIGRDKEQSVANALQQLVKEKTLFLMWEEAEKYYNHMRDGKDIFIYIPETFSDNDIFEFKMQLSSVDCITVTNENTVAGGTELKAKTFIPLQSNIMDILRLVKLPSMGNVVVRAEYFTFDDK